MILSERVKAIVEYSGLSIPKYAQAIGVQTPQAIRDLINGKTKSISDNIKSKILSYSPEINASWLFTGEGDMLLTPSSNEAAVINYKDGVPYYDEDFILGFNELGFPSSENPEFLVRMPKYSNATLWCNATGHSMEPEINNGDVIALQLIEDPSFLFTGDLYAIVTTNGLRTIKRLGKGKDDNHYRLIPTNKQYEEQDIPKSVILRVFRVLGNLHSF